MPEQPNQLMTHIKYAETLISKALAFNRRARKVRAALLVSALRELQAEMREAAEISQVRPE